MNKWVEFTAEYYDYYNRLESNFSSTSLSDLYRKINPYTDNKHVGRLEIKFKEHYDDVDFVTNLALIYLAGDKKIMIQKTENNYTIIDLSEQSFNSLISVI